MDDKQLLERAARAAGRSDFNADTDAVFWNPLESDSDAFRLMVDLSITVGLYGGGGVSADAAWLSKPIYLKFKDDPRATVRRAIVRAAAAMAGEE